MSRCSLESGITREATPESAPSYRTSGASKYWSTSQFLVVEEEGVERLYLRSKSRF